jgi:hypothetical protein
MPPVLYSLVLAGLISVAEALTGDRTAHQRLYRAGYMFTCCMTATVAGGWIMFLIHR